MSSYSSKKGKKEKELFKKKVSSLGSNMGGNLGKMMGVNLQKITIKSDLRFLGEIIAKL